LKSSSGGGNGALMRAARDIGEHGHFDAFAGLASSKEI